MNSTEIRKASLSDLDGIMAVIRDAQKFMAGSGLDQWQNGNPSREHFIRDIARGECHVIMSDGDIRGVFTLVFGTEPCYEGISGSGWLTGGSYATLHRAALNSSLRGTGAAAAMLDFCKTACRERGIGSLRADTHRDNKPMRGLLQRHGFSYCGVVWYPYPDAFERVAYEKVI